MSVFVTEVPLVFFGEAPAPVEWVEHEVGSDGVARQVAEGGEELLGGCDRACEAVGAEEVGAASVAFGCGGVSSWCGGVAVPSRGARPG
jgi:hypothetical protein